MSTSVTNVNNHFPSAENGFTTTTSSSTAPGAVTVEVHDLSGYDNGEVVVFVIEPTSAAKQTFTGIVDTGGLQITNVVWTAGSNQTHNAGSVVVDFATATHVSMISKGLSVEHNQDGTHKIPEILDSNGNETLILAGTGSAVNELTVGNATTGNSPYVQASGSDANIDIRLIPKGSGAVIAPNPYKFKATTDNATTLTASAYTKIQWGTEEFDTNNDFNATTDEYTVPVSGFYHFSACVNATAGGSVGRHGITLYKNGVISHWGSLAYTAISVTTRRTLSVFDQFTAGDVISVRMFVDGSNATVAIDSTGTYFSGYLVSQT